ncbi:MAG: universal stress protein [Roseateles sp.]|uniref:universal stress protein n=1 Tax=Roseateles sp. TaxID=1971397 RepID=UPI004037234D
MKILLAVDGSAYTQHMLAYLALHERWFEPGHAYTVFHAVQKLPGGLIAAMSDEAVQARYDAEAEEVFAPVRDALQVRGLKPAFQHRVGDPGRLVAQHADQGGYDLVVLGSHGHGALSAIVVGSVVTKVLALCRVPALIVRGPLGDAL